MSESELIEEPYEITAEYLPNEGGIMWQGEAYLPADYVLSRGQEPVAYALWWPENILHGVILANQISQFDYEKFRVVPLYAHPETPEPSEWEYTWSGEDWILDDEVFPSPQVAENWIGLLSTRRWVREEGGYLVRRRKAGEWEPVESTEGER